MSQPRSNLKGNFWVKVAHKSVESKGWIRVITNSEISPDSTFFPRVEW